ncbi:hypothetical protein Xmau_02844 [Xenorhabdus mauleonii]|uniref:Uncharacterized protein n=1 Tax=Xenorhabdus mauleonii TaxID=351675 RepID=A0A1I3IGZ9_9GAMM|nr:hypothetical protein Xmau_02844 [Xenorhabdus mauleonii]SFI47139.1 hypothetical protein SAMN05421680_101340 [Xenorhabdus mauleonii]
MASNNLPKRPGIDKSVLPLGFGCLLTDNVIIGKSGIIHSAKQ